MAAHSSDPEFSESMEEENHSFLDMELEALQSIYINELEVKIEEKCTTVSIDLHPSTADKLDEQYVRMTLEFILEEEYPEKIPEIKIRNPRGLSDEKLNCIVKDLLMIAESKKGSSMLFEMIDAAKEHLTVGNRPSGECAICLYCFSDNDVFTKTECYHYFHSHCLARFTRNFIKDSEDHHDAKDESVNNKQLLCPVCRVPIEFNGFDVDYPPPEESAESTFAVSEDMIELQKKMADLYQKQVEKGGIIDVEAEKKKYLLEISNVPTRVIHEEKLEQKSVTEGDSVTDDKVEQSDDVDSPVSERKEHVRDFNRKFDYGGKNRNFNRPNDHRNNYRYDHRYNKQSYDNFRGNYHRNKYGKQNSGSSYRHREESEVSHERTKDSFAEQDLVKSEDLASSQDIEDNASETSEQPSPSLKSKHNSNFSPRYNRGFRHRGNNYGNYHNNSRRPDKSGYHERYNTQTSRRYSAMRGEEPSPNKSKERTDDDLKTYDDSSRKPNRSGNFKYDDDYYSKQRYPDSRNSSQRGFNKGAYGRRDNYSNPHNNYSRNSRYAESRDREQYSERNYKEKRTYRDDKYRASGDGSYDRYKQGPRNYTGNRPGRYSDKSYAESSNYESESVELSSQNQNSDANSVSLENESLGSSKHQPDSFEGEEGSLQKKDATDLNEKGSDKLTDVVPAFEGNSSNSFPNVDTENTQVTSRTVNPPPGFANPLKKVIYGLQGANPPPGFNRS